MLLADAARLGLRLAGHPFTAQAGRAAGQGQARAKPSSGPAENEDPEEGNGLPGARAGLSMPDRANRFPDRCWRAGPGRAADRAARTAGGGPRACVGGVNVWLTGHQIRSKLACP